MFGKTFGRTLKKKYFANHFYIYALFCHKECFKTSGTIRCTRRLNIISFKAKMKEQLANEHVRTDRQMFGRTLLIRNSLHAKFLSASQLGYPRSMQQVGRRRRKWRRLFSKSVERLCKAVNIGSLEGSPSLGDPLLAWGVPWSGDPLAQRSPGPGIVPWPGDCTLDRALFPCQGIDSWPGGCPLPQGLLPVPGGCLAKGAPVLITLAHFLIVFHLLPIVTIFYFQKPLNKDL